MKSSELITVVEGPTGSTEIRPNVHTLTLRADAIESVFALDLTGTIDGIDLHLIEGLGDDVVALVATSEQAAALGGRTLSPGVHQITVPLAAVQDTQGVQRILTDDVDNGPADSG